MNAVRQIVKRTPKLLFDRLKFTDEDGLPPFLQDVEVTLSNTSGIPVPSSLTGPFATDIGNAFLPRDPEEGEQQNLTAVTIMKAILYPSEKLKTALAANGNFNRVLANSIHPAMIGLTEEERRNHFLNGIASACALTSRQVRIRGKTLADLYKATDKQLAECTATLLAVNIESRLGVKVSAQLYNVAKAGQLNAGDIERTANRLAKDYADFRIYYSVLKSTGESLNHIMEIENGNSGAGLLPPQGGPQMRQRWNPKRQGPQLRR